MKIALVLLPLALATGCASYSVQKQSYAVGHVPCLQRDIQADDAPPDRGTGSSSFEVGCAGKHYVCSIQCTSYSGFLCANAVTQCTELARQAAPLNGAVQVSHHSENGLAEPADSEE